MQRAARLLLATILLVALPGCGGPASCPFFDDDCREAARFFQDATGMEPSFARDVPCEGEWDVPPVRCIEFAVTLDSIAGVALFADGALEIFDRPAVP